ncbi:maleylpyruvate isomerase family mycothiol-dependent enzyme [Nocardioides humilatus]|uniref:Maleylpyruvate isomerase family mycothiol-dependent enzyme n=1 Tax=Nocardioides humilatus TaxID=2607660 RepID=A0A5B1LKU6_9ACTN|nr:maleylpyruvate isomerase family mycothiol-dependent enzyme [Nocardioides humilatus]KAA1421322.1 maleylpyruvate isomerase family mycothiol-dependent enzyme [Nocardioides humilatus]
MDWIPLLRDATTDFAEVLADGDLDAPVPSCPGWSLRDLADHLGGVHQWATHAVVVGDPKGQPTPAPADKDGLVRWYRESARGLVDVLKGTPVEATAWTFGPEQVAGFWRRRQVHETVMHLYDALLSQGREAEWSPTPELAWDGVDEVATIFYARQVRLERIEPLPGTLRCVATDVDAAPVEIGSGDPGAELTGSSSYLLLALWKRATVEDPGAAELLQTAITP